MGNEKIFNLRAGYNLDITSTQARQLVELDNDEPDRLNMAKASFRTITDTDDFNLVIDIFTTQAYRDDLVAFIKSNR